MSAIKSLTVEQAAAALGISSQAVRRKIALGKLKAARIGNAWLIRPAAVERAKAARAARSKEKIAI